MYNYNNIAIKHDFGLLMILDDLPPKPMQIQDNKGLNWFNTFSLRTPTQSVKNLKLYREGKMHQLLSSNEDVCLAHDSDIQVYKDPVKA